VLKLAGFKNVLLFLIYAMRLRAFVSSVIRDLSNIGFKSIISSLFIVTCSVGDDKY